MKVPPRVWFLKSPILHIFFGRIFLCGHKLVILVPKKGKKLKFKLLPATPDHPSHRKPTGWLMIVIRQAAVYWNSPPLVNYGSATPPPPPFLKG